jgi:hypothetical protein
MQQQDPNCAGPMMAVSIRCAVRPGSVTTACARGESFSHSTRLSFRNIEPSRTMT